MCQQSAVDECYFGTCKDLRSGRTCTLDAPDGGTCRRHVENSFTFAYLLARVQRNYTANGSVPSRCVWQIPRGNRRGRVHIGFLDDVWSPAVPLYGASAFHAPTDLEVAVIRIDCGVPRISFWGINLTKFQPVIAYDIRKKNFMQV